MCPEQVSQNDFEEIVKEEDIIQLVGFKLGDEEYAIDILKVQEIIRMVEITSVPRVDHFVLGVMNLRGKVIPVVDLRLRFNLDKSDFDKNTRIIVVNFEKESIGFVVDEVTEVMRITKSIVEPTPPLVGSVGQEYILGICKYNERLIILLDIDRVIFGEGKYDDSELKKKFFTKPESVGASQFVESDRDVEETVVNDSKVDISIEKESKQPEKEAIEKDEVKEAELDYVNENMIGVEESSEKIEEDVTISQTEEIGVEDIDDIDALIAQELAKREKETEELIKKKKARLPDTQEVLEDALKQSEEVLGNEEEYVSQDDLDALIAQELAKREKETEELIKRKKEKKNLNDEDSCESNVVDEVESFADKDLDSKNSDSIIIERDSLEELKSIAEKIINGETAELDIDIKGEIGELLKLLVETKRKVDEVEPTVDDSSRRIPSVKDSLDDVTERAENAAFNLMNNVEKMLSVYKSIEDDLSSLEKYISSADKNSALSQIENIEKRLAELDNMGFEMLNSLEFQDITEQKIRKIISYTEEIGAKFGAILGYMKVKQMQGEQFSVSQEEVDKLLSDFGLN
ncbi:chemotaxis protein CheW [Deferribacter autotrophicus]|uniref:Chemotaxis protein CheW n=1 Tax=Deferribacter autotrophicus TaxID=500465 RepID=A0A5A8F4V7_9BACT|nr:chemotaxis protein CheW [Deferribacter autotrophicus]KAA0258404.1 chemotaxis protein CheW [Deferribacter autotrophicus]